VEDPKLGIRTRNSSEEAEILQRYEFNNQKSTIMIVEDETEMLQFMNDLFAEEYNVIPLNNPRMAEEILRDMHPSIIITDVMMPGVDGISLTRKIKSNPETSHLPILVLSAKHEMDKQIEALDAGAEMYITKPFNIDFLKVTVRQVLGRKETLRNYFNSPFSAFDLNVGKLTHIDDKKFMKNILSIINENLTNEELSVQFIAKELNICSRQLYRKLEQIGEDSPTNIIRECRLNKAKDLLLTSKMTIDEIVFKSGFSNKVTFFLNFNKKFNCTPK
jgi:DNA-binding response OmpR family regulator